MVASAASVTAVLAEALEIGAPQAAALSGFGSAAGTYAADALSASLGQPVMVGRAAVRRVAPGEVESENWDLFHPVDVIWETGGAAHSALVLLPKSELQNVLPSARGSADLPDMEALSALLHQLAEYLSGELMMMVPVTFSLAGANGGQPANPNQPHMRLEHVVSAGPPGAETHLTVSHLVPDSALRSIAARAPVPADFDAGALAVQAADPPSTSTATAETAPAPQPAESAAPPAPVSAAPPTFSSTPPAATPARHQARPTEESIPMATGPTAAQPAGTSVHPVQFQPFDGESEGLGGTNLELLLDVSLRVAVELGRTDLTIKDVLALGPGSVVELDKLAGEPVDILVNDRLIAKGEVVVVDENFGVRVTDIVSPQKRIGKLR